MLKIGLAISAFFLIIVFFLFIIWGSSTAIYWGHHFTFENELRMEIDSLEITVGDQKTVIKSGGDNLDSLEGNINVPELWSPQKVEILIYSKQNTTVLQADSFNCYNCDGSHMYILRKSGAKYKFLN